ncbi:hypothetical protein FO519_002846 [Halicephalobus sp. NKZ332]|nr:hypothetical protein FO519_002846 [Halicephalobus sp. NKZ332]
MLAKGIAFFAALLVIAAGSQQAYRADHEYSYEYDGQIASSLSNGEQFSASRLRALVKLSFVSDKSVIVQLERPQLGKWNDYLDRPNQIHKFDKFERVEIKSEHAEKLALPFQMRFNNGKISEIKFHSDDNVFSENIKRSVMNALQVQLEDSSDKTAKIPESETTGYAFRVNETTIEGECESFYTVTINNKDTTEYNVTKSIDFTQCRRRPELRYNYFRYTEPQFQNPMSLNEEENRKQGQKMMESEPGFEISSMYEYNLEGDRRQFVVKESKVVSRYSQVMMHSESVQVITYSIVQLTLKNVERKEIKEKTFSTKSLQTLMHSDEHDISKERFITEGDETYLSENPYMRMLNAASVISNIMKRLVDSTSANKESPEGIDEHSTRYMSQLVSILRLASKADIEQIHNELFLSTSFEGRNKHFVQEILADALAIAGTKNTLDHLYKKIQAKEITPLKASATLSKLMNLRLISNDMTQEMMKLCKSNYVQEHTTLKRTCFMTYGAMVNAMCRAESPRQHSDKWTTASSANKKYCPESLQKEIVNDIVKMFNAASTRADRILALKTLGNMGLESSLSHLEQIIRDQNIERIVRIQAIDALRQLRKDYPRQIQQILMPIFQDQDEHAEIRMNAVYQLLHSAPENAVLDMIMTQLTTEPSEHVKSFVSQLVHKMAENAHQIEDRETAQKLRSTLKHFNLFTEDDKTHASAANFFSTVVSVEPSQIHDLLTQFNLATVFGNDSYLPKEIMASMDLLVTGRLQQNFYQTGLHTQDLEQLVERLYSSLQSKSFDEIVTRGRRSLTEEYNPLNMLKNLYNKMQIVTRRNSQGSPLLMLYTRWQDMDTSFCLTDEDSIPQLFKSFMIEGRINVSPLENKDIPFHWNSASYGFEQQTKIPTTFGVPLVMTVRMPTIAMLDAQMSVSFADKEEENRVRAVSAQLKGETKFATTMIIKMEVFSPLFTSGVKTLHSAQFRLPLHVSAKLRSPSWMPHFEIQMPSEEIRVLHLQSRPVTFYRIWPAKSGVFIEAEEKTMIVEETTAPLKEKTIRVVDPFTQMNINIDAHWHQSPLTSNQKLIGDWLLSGENAFELKIQPTAQTSKAIKLSLDVLSKKSESHNIQTPDLEALFGEYTKQMFKHTDNGEMKLIRDQIKMAASRLNNFFQVTIKAESVQGADPHVAMLDWKTICDDRNVLCILNADIDVDTEWSMKTIAHVARPELRGLVSGFPTQHLVAKCETGFGSDKKNTIVMNLYGRPSQNKIQELKRWLNTEVEKSTLRQDELFSSAPRVVKPNDFVLIVENRLTTGWENAMHKLHMLLNVLPSTTVNIPERTLLEAEASKPKQTLMARMIYDNEANLTVSVPTRGNLQVSWEDLPKASSYETKSKNFYDLLRRSENTEAECSIKRGQYIKSFDGKSYKLPMTTCYTILAKDCTETPRFALMAKKMTQDSDDLKIKFMTQKKTYELYRTNHKMVVKVDGMLILESDFEKYGIYKIANEDIYELRCDFTAASVRFDGFNIMVRIADEYMNRQCGVCGHYNGDRNDELRMHDNEQTDNLREFHKSYLYRGEECELSALEALEKDSSEEGQEESYRMDIDENMEKKQEDREIEPVRKTDMVETHNEVCFSKMPIEQCPEGSSPSKSRMAKVEYFCLKRSSSAARKMLKELREKNIIEVERSNSERQVRIPRMCVEAI